MVSQQRLPVELLDHCYSFVDDSRTLAVACRTNSTLKSIARPKLYKTLRVPDSGFEGQLGLDDRNRRLSLLCRTLLEESNLAAQCNSLQIRHYKGDDSNEHGLLSIDVDLCMTVLREQRKLAKPYRDNIYHWLTVVRGSRQDLFILLIIILCPGIRDLNASGKPSVWKDMHYLTHTMSELRKKVQGRGLSPALTSISNVVLTNDAAYGEATRTDDLPPFLELPCIRMVTTDFLAPSDHRRGVGPPVQSPGSNVEVLNIETCQAMASGVAFTIRECPELRVLNVQWVLGPEAHSRMDYAYIGKTVCRHCTKLESLHLDYIPRQINLEWLVGADDQNEMDDLNVSCFSRYEKDFMQWSPEFLSDDARRCIGSLKSLRHLTDLTITENALDSSQGHQTDGGQGGEVFEAPTATPDFSGLLPPTLKRLTVICEDGDVRQKAAKLLADPYVASLEEMIVINISKNHWFSKTRGEGGLELAESKKQKVQWLKELRRRFETL